MNEKRQGERLNWSAEAKLFCVDDKTEVVVRLTDISEGGCFIDTIVPLSAGARVILRVNSGGHVLEAPGTILYVQPSIGSAIQFDSSARNQDQLRIIIGDRSRQQ
jgi:hypothetical protein